MMSDAEILRQKAEMFERRAEGATDPISKQHYREMAAHYRQLLVEHLDVQPTGGMNSTLSDLGVLHE